eukprot:gene17423-19854_t
MSDSAESYIIFQGSKFFWRTRNSIDVTIAQHSNSYITEIIAYEPSIDVEAERIYLNTTLLHDRLDKVAIDLKFSFAKQNNVPISTEFISSVMNNAITDYVITRLLISKFSKDESKFEVKLEFSSRDVDESQGGQPIVGLICAKVPDELKPFETINHKLLAAGAVDAALQALAEESVQLKASCAEAATHHTEAVVPLTMKERWRIPIVLGKLDTGKTLNAGDTKIWEAVSSNLKTQEDIDRVTNVTMRTATTKAQLDARNAISARKETKTAPSPVNRAPVTPARSPMATPRSQTVTPRLGVTPRGVSSRLLAGTVTSQARAQCVAEDNSSPTATVKLTKKPSKRGSTGTLSRSGSKILRRTSTRRLAGPAGSGDSKAEHEEADYSESNDFSSSLVGISENTRSSFVSQVATGLSSFAATFSTKTKPSTPSSKEASATQRMSAESESDRHEANNFAPASRDSSESPPPHHTLSDMMSFLTRGRSSLRNLGTHSDVVSDSKVSTLSSGGAHAGLEVEDNQGSGSAPAASKMESAPAKRRSFFGALFSPLMRADSGTGVPSNKVHSTYSPSSVPATHASATKGSASDQAAMEDAAVQDVKLKPMPSSQQTTVSSSLSSWLPWGHSPTPSTSVVPVNLAESTRAQFV